MTLTIYPCGCRLGAEVALCAEGQRLRDAANAAFREHGGSSDVYLEAEARWREHVAVHVPSWPASAAVPA